MDIIKKLMLVVTICVLLVSMTGCPMQEQVNYKPVIYLYPTEETEVTVKLDYAGEFICTYPEYDGEWKVNAFPDGKNHKPG